MKSALVTGGNSGIGYATARKLKEAGFDVCISGRNQHRTQQASKQLGCDYIIADLSTLEGVHTICDAFEGRLLDILVNNAGICKAQPLLALGEQDLQEQFTVNVYAPMLLTQSIVPALKQTQGTVINISSAITYRGTANFSVYAATKGALEAWTRNLAVELAPDNIRVNAICPGAIDTPIFGKMGIPEENINTVMADVKTTIPLGRLGAPEDIADVVMFLVSSGYVTGAILHADGGVGA